MAPDHLRRSFDVRPRVHTAAHGPPRTYKREVGPDRTCNPHREVIFCERGPVDHTAAERGSTPLSVVAVL